MIRPLDDLILLKEIDASKNIEIDSLTLRKKYPDKVVFIRRIAYLKKDALGIEELMNLTDLSSYIQLGELASHLVSNKFLLLEKIYFMEKTKLNGSGINLFEYKKICGIYFIKLHDSLKDKMLKYQPFLATYNDAQNMVCGDMLGDLKIGFY